jgi:hypothetical protein
MMSGFIVLLAVAPDALVTESPVSFRKAVQLGLAEAMKPNAHFSE